VRGWTLICGLEGEECQIIVEDSDLHTSDNTILNSLHFLIEVKITTS